MLALLIRLLNLKQGLTWLRGTGMVPPRMPGEEAAAVDDADDKDAKHRAIDPAMSQLYSVVADARAAAASGSGGARPPRSPSRGLPQQVLDAGGGPRHRRTPSAADRSAREARSYRADISSAATGCAGRLQQSEGRLSSPPERQYALFAAWASLLWC